MSDFDAQIDDFLISKVKDVASSATSYSLQKQQVLKFYQFRSILKYGYLYSFDKSSFGAIRGCATRLNQDNQSISAGEFYKIQSLELLLINRAMMVMLDGLTRKDT